MIFWAQWGEVVGHCFRKDNSMLLIFGQYCCIFGVAFLRCFNGPFLGHIGLVYLCQGRLSPSSCELPEDGFEHPGRPCDRALSPIDLWLEVIQPWVPEDDAWLPKVGDKECLDFVLVSLLDL
jgi:hypothetical protein